MNYDMLFAPFLVDGYKTDHRRQYPSNASLVFSNFTPRGTRVEGCTKVILDGLQYLMDEYLINVWNKTFFEKPLEEVVARFEEGMLEYIGPNRIGTQHIIDLHNYGKLPLEIWALPEGSAVDLRVSMFVLWNSRPDKLDPTLFAWITNNVETIVSNTTWLACTSATTALMYRQLLEGHCQKTNPDMIEFVKWQGHDFSMRGHGSLESSCLSGGAHLLSFYGTDTMPARDYLKFYYGADAKKEIIGGSVAATEHSVMCMGGMEDEVGTFKRLITETYPDGIISIVSDTWDFWQVVNPDGGIVSKLKTEIMAREGKVVIRPDSGDPVRIVAGYREDEITRADGRIYTQGTVGKPGKYLTELEVKGMIQCLWETFGGTETSTGFKQLDSHIGAIYGDAITLDRADEICKRLAEKGFASTNIVFGIGSFTYQGAISEKAIVTRDTHGFAIKSTFGEVVEVDGSMRGIAIFKDPKTDDGLKRSARGLIAVYENPDGSFTQKDEATWEEVKNCAFRQVFKDGKVTLRATLAEKRALMEKNLARNILAAA